MLVRLFAENYGVFRDGFSLSLEAENLPSDKGRGYFEVEIEGEDEPLRLLRLAAIYGPNASGKSTVIQAANALSNLVLWSGPSRQEGSGIPEYNPFMFDRGAQNAPCTLGCEVVVRKAIFEYSISFTATEVTRERIVEHSGKEERVWLDRTSEGGIQVREEFLGQPMTINLDDVTRNNAAALSVAAQLGQKPLALLFNRIKKSLGAFASQREEISPFLSVGHGLHAPSIRINRLHEDEAFRKWTLEKLLKPADIGITDVSTEVQEVPEEFLWRLTEGLADEEQIEEKRNQVRQYGRSVSVKLVHKGVDGEFDLSIHKESDGTRKMLAMAGPWYDAVQHGLAMFVDELSASLHPTLLAALLEAFNAPPTSKPSQLVFTSHDPTLLEEAVRRDQVYFTEKNDEGMASLYSLSEFKERQGSVHNYRKRYLEGRYGAIPRLLDFGSLFESQDD